MEGVNINKMFTLKKHRIADSSSLFSISDLDEDALVEILSRLPIKHLVSCKSVSKVWYKIVSTICIPKITSTPVHAILFNVGILSPNPNRNHRGPWTFAWLNSPNKTSTLTELCHFLPFTLSPKYLLDCCNGFLLLFDPSSMQYYLCNPSTEQYLAIPNLPNNNIPVSGALIIESQCCKIIHISLIPFTMHIFSLETRVWVMHNLHIEVSVLELGLCTRRLFTDDSFYTLAYSGYLLKFDIKQVCVRAIELPKVVVRNEDPLGCIGMSQGRLHYAWDDLESRMMIWMLGEGDGDADDWVLKCTICHQDFLQHQLCISGKDVTMFCVYAFDPISSVVFVGDFTGIYRYDPCTKKMDVICTLERGTLVSAGQYYVYPFSCSLITLDTFTRTVNG